jgi:hypothetical protein
VLWKISSYCSTSGTCSVIQGDDPNVHPPVTGQVPVEEQHLLNFQSTYVHPPVTGQVPLVEQQLLNFQSTYVHLPLTGQVPLVGTCSVI